MTSDLLTVKETASWFKCDICVIYREIQAGRIPGFKLGGTYRVSAAVLEHWIREQERASLVTMHKIGKYRGNGW